MTLKFPVNVFHTLTPEEPYTGLVFSTDPPVENGSVRSFWVFAREQNDPIANHAQLMDVV